MNYALFGGRLSKIEGSNLGALEIMTALQVESVQHTQMPSSGDNAPSGSAVDILRQWLKMKFPHLVRAVRKLRK